MSSLGVNWSCLQPDSEGTETTYHNNKVNTHSHLGMHIVQNYMIWYISRYSFTILILEQYLSRYDRAQADWASSYSVPNNYFIFRNKVYSKCLLFSLLAFLYIMQTTYTSKWCNYRKTKLWSNWRNHSLLD